jgi:hypothetical protein
MRGMNSEVLSAAIGGVCTLFGVAIGAAGTLGSARAQTRGATAQADAMLEQAKATYEAALGQAEVSHRAAYLQWRRGVQRDAYAAFVAALDELEGLVGEPELLDTDDSGNSERLNRASATLRKAHAAVQLEGPPSLASLAGAVRDSGGALVTAALRLAPRARALRLLAAATDDLTSDRAAEGSPGALALDAHLALTRLREAAFHHDAGRTDRSGYDAAQRRAAAALDACGLFTGQQKRALLSDPTWDGAQRGGRTHADATEQLARARTEFTDAARTYLDSGAPQV